MKKLTYLHGIIVIAGLGFIVGCATRSHSLGSTPVIVYAPAVTKSGSEGTCPGAFSGYICYTQAPPAWGWEPLSSATSFSASNGGQCTNVRIEFVGEYGDTGCSVSNVVIPNPPFSPSYTFNAYFRSSLPTTNYPIILTGFSTN